MAFTTFPSTTSASAPGTNDDNTKGYVVGSQWIHTGVSPRVVYICTNASTGAATWITAGGVSSHTSLTTLGWSAAGHTGTQTSVACFDGTGAAQTVQATADGQVLQRVGGVLVFATLAIAVGLGGTEDRSLDVWYLDKNADVIAVTASAAFGPGSIV